MAAGDQYDKTTLGTSAGKTNMSRPMGSSGASIKKGSDPSFSQIMTGIMGRARQNEAADAQEKRLADDLKQARIDAFKSQAEKDKLGPEVKAASPVETTSLFADLTARPLSAPTGDAVAMSVGDGSTAENDFTPQSRQEASADKVYPTDPKLPDVYVTRPAEPPSMIGGRPAADVLKEMRQSASEKDVLNEVKRVAAERAKAFDPVKGYEDSLKDYQASFNSGDSDQTFTDKKNKPQEIYDAASSLEQAKITANSLKRAAPLAQRDSALLRDALQEQRKQRDTVPNKAAKPKRSAFRN